MGLLSSNLVGRLLAKARRVVAVLWEDEDVYTSKLVAWGNTEHAARLLHEILLGVYTDLLRAQIADAIDPIDRKIVERSLHLLDCFARDELLKFELSGTEHEEGLYWACARLQEAVRGTTWCVAGTLPAGINASAWYHLGEMLCHALHLVRQRLARSEAGGNAANAIVGRVLDMWARHVVQYQSDQDKVYAWALRREAQARYEDALEGWAGTEELRQAFNAAWRIGKYAFAVALVRGIAADRPRPEPGRKAVTGPQLQRKP